jgi:SAM-dependent methyltransferase
VPPRELWVGPQDPFIHFVRWIWEFRAYLVLLCELQRDAAVLELGCGHGRTMLGLLDYLKPPGRYEGLDIMPRQIAFAQEAIQATHPHCCFTLADVQNSLYNPTGRSMAESYVFPYENAVFDVAFAASLFTHLTPAATRNYLRQTRRVLKPGGRCLFSFFVLDGYRGPGTSAWSGYEFNHPLDGEADVAVHNPAMPEELIAYRSARIEAIAAEVGLAVRRIVPGVWSNSYRSCVNEQDLVLLHAV